MNEHITVAFLNGDLKDTAGEKIVFTETYAENVFLAPYYCTEDDVIGVFMQDRVKYWDMTRKLIFDASVKVDFMLRTYKFNTALITSAELFMLKHDYVICKAVYEFSKRFNADMLKQVNKSKQLGDLKVSISMQKMPNAANIIMKDSELCLKELEEIFQELSGKGSGLIASFNRSKDHVFPVGRQWYPGEPSEPMVPIATRHWKHMGKFYKIGSF